MDTTIIATLILGGTGIFVTIYYSRQSQRLAHEQMQKQLFAEFNHRYSQINDYLIEIEKNYPTIGQLDKAERGELLKQKVNDYFSLCAEEFYWYYHKKRIERLIWNSWHNGMNYWYENVPAIKELWEKEVRSNGKSSYYITNHVEFFTEKPNLVI